LPGGLERGHLAHAGDDRSVRGRDGAEALRRRGHLRPPLPAAGIAQRQRPALTASDREGSASCAGVTAAPRRGVPAAAFCRRAWPAGVTSSLEAGTPLAEGLAAAGGQKA